MLRSANKQNEKGQSAMTEPEAQLCCGPDVRRDYEVSADNTTLRCTDCGKTYTRESVQAEAQPRGGELLPCPFCGVTPSVFDHSIKGLKDEWSVYCEGEMCAVAPSTTGEFRGHAVSQWNNQSVARTTPRATGETTVESCLAELREMFPLPHDLRIALSDYGRVINAEIYRDARLIAKGKTLVDCMAQVRAAAQTKAESGEK